MNNGEVLMREIIIPIDHGDDDCEERVSTGKPSLHDADLDLREGRNVGLMFLNLEVENEAKIASAFIEFHAKSDKHDTCQLRITCDSNANPRQFDNEPFNVQDRFRHKTAIPWHPNSWPAGSVQRTPELAPLVQEVVNGGLWHSGNHICFVIEGLIGHRNVWSYDGNPELCPILCVKVEEKAPNQAETGPVQQGYDPYGHMKVEAPPPPPPPGPMDGVGSSAGGHFPIPINEFRTYNLPDQGSEANQAPLPVALVEEEPMPPPPPEDNPWELQAYPHDDQGHAAPPVHSQPAHLIYEDKFRYPRYNLSHECLRPTKLDVDLKHAKPTPGYEYESGEVPVPAPVVAPSPPAPVFAPSFQAPVVVPSFQAPVVAPSQTLPAPVAVVPAPAPYAMGRAMPMPMPMPVRRPLRRGFQSPPKIR